jgi:MFS family permease
MFGAIALTAILLQVVGGRSPVETGLLMVIQPLFMVVLSPFAGRLSDRVGSRWLATGGMVLVALGLAGLATVPAGVPASHLLPSLALVGVGMAAFSSPNTSAAMGAVPVASLGAASGLLAVMRSLGQSVSVALLGAIAAANLGERGGRVLLGGDALPGDALAYLDGYHAAMAVGALVALAGAAVSLTRG